MLTFHNPVWKMFSVIISNIAVKARYICVHKYALNNALIIINGWLCVHFLDDLHSRYSRHH